ncbi:MAG: hypothetical protein R3C56_13480 [Pirellulaceae bacterium]
METRGDGSSGKKASGMLMVEGTLYLLRVTPAIRNWLGHAITAAHGIGTTGNSPKVSVALRF